MRLISWMSSTLARQAAIAAIGTGVLLALLSYQIDSAAGLERERERLDAFATMAAAEVRGGRPLDLVIRDLEVRGSRLAGRIQLADPQGRMISGSVSGPVIAEQSVRVGGKTVGVARLIGPIRLSDPEQRLRLINYAGITAIMLFLFLALFLSGRRFATRWARPQLELARLSNDVVHGNYDVEFEENVPAEVVGTMRNLRRLASQFSRVETARRTWLVAIADELRQPTENMGEHFIALCAVEPALPRPLLTAIESDARRLIQMSEDLSAVALADLGRLPVQFEPLDARTLATAAIDSHAAQAKAQNVGLSLLDLPAEPVSVRWDAERLAQLYAALIENSLRYTPRGGSIQLSIESARDAWRLIVDDSAPGVDVMLAQRLFEPFYRSADRRDESAASGLALATARAIVEAHHGRIEAGRSPIGGLRVSVILPANPPMA